MRLFRPVLEAATAPGQLNRPAEPLDVKARHSASTWYFALGHLCPHSVGNHVCYSYVVDALAHTTWLMHFTQVSLLSFLMFLLSHVCLPTYGHCENYTAIERLQRLI